MQIIISMHIHYEICRLIKLFCPKAIIFFSSCLMSQLTARAMPGRSLHFSETVTQTFIKQ